MLLSLFYIAYSCLSYIYYCVARKTTDEFTLEVNEATCLWRRCTAALQPPHQAHGRANGILIVLLSTYAKQGLCSQERLAINLDAMAAISREKAANTGDAADSHRSSVPLLGEGFTEKANTERNDDAEDDNGNTEALEADSKPGKRRFWGLGKKKDDEKARKKREAAAANNPQQSSATAPAMRPVSPIFSAGGTGAQTAKSYPYGTPSSPGQNLPSSSPHIPSPASSQIFERNVQDDGPQVTASPAIPGHITTENHIPPALDASTEAITNDHLDPDHVEIVTHTGHLPAAMTVAGASASEIPSGVVSQEDLVSRPNIEETASKYGALDVNDVRRLSFISFADVMHAEQAENAGTRDTEYLSSISGAAPARTLNRSPSPVLSPVSSHGMSGTPPMSGSASFKGLESSPNRGAGGLGSQVSGHSPPAVCELTIETMRQALRKTGSGDLSGARSPD